MTKLKKLVDDQSTAKEGVVTASLKLEAEFKMEKKLRD